MAQAPTPLPAVGRDVVGIGENSVDLVYRIPAVLTADGKQPIASYRESAGGQVATALCAAAALGLRTSYVGAFGSDEHGRMVRQRLAVRGVDVSSAPVRPVRNRRAVVIVDQTSGSRSILWERVPALALTPAELPAGDIAAARVVHVDDVDVAISLRAAAIARAAGRVVTADIDQITALTPALVDAVTHPIMARHVPSARTGVDNLERALRSLRQPHHALLTVTLGSRGALLLANDAVHHAPAPPIRAVDTTGAGDVFRGAFIYALLRGDTPDAILRFANAAAAVSCTREGAIDSVPTLAEIEQLLLP
jgi:sugar/nucleoside kinase (ribokinase family)